MSATFATLLAGGLTALVGVFSIFNAIGAAFVAQRAQKRAKVVEIYDEYYSPENYRRVVLPVFRIMLKWWNLPQPQQDEYRAVLRRGWVGYHSDVPSVMTTYLGSGYLEEDPDHAHFHKLLPSEAFTEHESLTVFLYFWTKVHELLRAGVIDRKTAQRLLAIPYGYLSKFIREFRADIAQHSEAQDLPPWYEATEELERLFASESKAQPN